MHESEKWKWSRSVVSNSSRPHGLQPTRLLHSWDFPGKSTGVGCHCLLHTGHYSHPNSPSPTLRTEQGTGQHKITSPFLGLQAHKQWLAMASSKGYSSVTKTKHPGPTPLTATPKGREWPILNWFHLHKMLEPEREISTQMEYTIEKISLCNTFKIEVPHLA